MDRLPLARLLALTTAGLLLPLSQTAHAQALPATPATSGPATSRGGVMSTMRPVAAVPSAPETSQHHRARVAYQNGLLEVQADNSSLNQILRDISRQTGMSIVGGVADQRIFGTYGPAPAVTVLKTLLDGTGTNMLLKETATKAPAQLILSPQTGGTSPPGPNSTSFDATENEPALGTNAAAAPRPQGSLPAPAAPNVPAPGTALGPPGPGSIYPTMPAPMNNPSGNPNNVSPTASTLPVTNSVPSDSLPVPSTVQPASGIVDAPNPPPTGSTTQGFTGTTPADNNPNTSQPQGANSTSNGANSTSNAPKTPQQIYEELRQLQQQKTPGNQGTTPSSAPQGTAAPHP